ncbi:probable LRR receptor-like serine/threonine-protein kinase At1g51810 isoform X2 [Panicum hallii]|uniref:probable LRR receptor-like serine/threonine-protein kinase At1g51810 isoform X2 n=1 Tax=Panicum hallii TaxID=206008 RepID=UPI000DF4E099|nr:probable LRR receptor-like serine/threonine-protein kinase At1g51810 isoform X2 [Panicum hallii]
MAFLVLLAAVLLVLSAQAVHHVAGQPGFLSIDCGLDDEYSGYMDPDSGIVYVSDGAYADAGENLKVAPEYESQFGRRYQTVRSFPSGVRNCYALPTVAGAKYLARLEARYGNHDGTNDSSAMEFDVHLGANYWDTVLVRDDVAYEVLFVAWAGWASVCLLNTGHGAPFLSILELRRLGDALYPALMANQTMSIYVRSNMGGKFTRFPDDPYDRYWWRGFDPQWRNLSTAQNMQPDPSFVEPVAVLQTAATATGNNTALSYKWWQAQNRPAYSFMVLLHFADFQSAQLREFDIYFNGNRLGPSDKPYRPQYLASSTVCSSGWYRASDGNYNITLVASAVSELPPMLNAIEIYTLLAFDTPTTFPDDFDAIMAIKFEYGVKKNWTGDPCFPTIYAWDGVECSNTSGKTTRITSLDLSKSNLRGVLSTNFSKLTALENLDLSYNNLSGPIPDSLSSLPSLRVLNVSGNNLSGDSLCTNYNGSLIFRYDSDTSACDKRTSSSRKNAAVLITSVVVPVLVVAALFLACFIWRAKRKSNENRTGKLQLESAPISMKAQGDHLQDSESRRFTYKDLENITHNFERLIGQGGFGLVYYGRLEDGTMVAAKMRSESSSHGLDEFLAEVQSLTKVHHRNIVSLVGYCWEKNHLALVYEYMSQGSLYDHLRGKHAAVEILNWGTRVRIVLEAAQGLDYLHKGCSPPIIHRDVKSSNILLRRNLQAKIADMGLSRSYLSDTQTHISVTAAGTAGYMDPEYYLTGRLTESSDVYSFGIVLLEAATGEPPQLPGLGHIVQRVKQRMAAGDIGSIADSRLRGAYDVSSMWKVVDIAMACAADDGTARPTMADVVAQLKDSMALEDARVNDCRVPARKVQRDDAALMPSFGPSLR